MAEEKTKWWVTLLTKLIEVAIPIVIDSLDKNPDVSFTKQKGGDS